MNATAPKILDINIVESVPIQHTAFPINHNLKTPFGPRVAVRKHFLLPSLAKQSFGPECNINTIMARYAKNGVIDHLNKHQGSYTDMPASTDYHENLLIMQEAADTFATLPAAIRKDFDNDPGKFLAFVEDPESIDKMREYGLLPDTFGQPENDNTDAGNEPAPTPPKVEPANDE